MTERYEPRRSEVTGFYHVYNTKTENWLLGNYETWSQAMTEAGKMNTMLQEAQKAPRKAPSNRLTLHPAPDRPDLDALVRRGIAAFNAMPPEEQAAHRKAQAESWVRGNVGIDQGPDARQTVPIDPAPCCDCTERARIAAQVAEHFRAYIAVLALDGDTRAQRLIDEAVEMTGGNSNG